MQARVAGIVPQFGRFALVGASGVAVNLRFMLVSLAAYACQVAGFAAGLAHHLGRAASQLIAIACVMPINFLANRYWSFR